MKVVVINLHQAHRRANHINSQLNKQSIPHTFFYGLDNNQFKLRDGDVAHSNGLIGCYISHVLAYQNSKNTAATYLIILEDDYVLPENFLQQVNKAAEDLPDDTDIAFLYWQKLGQGEKYNAHFVNQTWQRCNGVWSTAALLIKVASIDKICGKLSKIHGHIDIVYADMGWKRELHVYYLKEPMGRLAGLASQIAK